MDTFLIVLLLLVALFIASRVIVGGRRSVGDYDSVERAFMPSELATAKLVLSEVYLRTEVPRRLGARFDQVYLTSTGELIPVDTKRHRFNGVTDYDRIEVSVQSAVLRHSCNELPRHHRVSEYGYIRLSRTDQHPVYRKFRILDDAALAALNDRYRAITHGTAAPRCARHAGICRKCAYLTSCTLGQRRLQGH